METAALLAEQGVRTDHHQRPRRRTRLSAPGPRSCVEFQVRLSTSSPETCRAHPAQTTCFEKVAALIDGPLAVLVNCGGGDFAPELFQQIPAEQLDGIVRHWLFEPDALLPSGAAAHESRQCDHQRRIRCREGADARRNGHWRGDGWHRDVLAHAGARGQAARHSRECRDSVGRSRAPGCERASRPADSARSSSRKPRRRRTSAWPPSATLPR